MSLEAGGEDVSPYLQEIQYAIDGHMDDKPVLIGWHYSAAGLRADVVSGQMDIEVLTPDSEHQFSVVAWLGIDAYEAGVAAYGVQDIGVDGCPLITWVNGARMSADLRYYDTKTWQELEDGMTGHEPAQLETYARLLRYGTPVGDALAVQEDSIHRRPSLESRVQTHLQRSINAFTLMAVWEAQERDP